MDILTIIILAIAGIAGVVVGHTLAVNRKVKHYQRRQEKQKEQNIQKIRELLQKNKTVTNNQVEELLGVSDATATRYLDQLEEEGIVAQKGEGRGTYYELR